MEEHEKMNENQQWDFWINKNKCEKRITPSYEFSWNEMKLNECIPNVKQNELKQIFP